MLWVSLAFGHGGPPHSETLFWTESGSMVVASTHGFLFEEGDWNWVCEEAFGDALPTDVVHTGTTLVVASTEGLARSADGCTWNWSIGFAEALIWDLAIHPNIPNQIWLVADDGLWVSEDGGLTFESLPSPAMDAKLRAVIPMDDGQLTLFGFLEGTPMVWQGREEWQSAILPVQGGQLIALGTDGAGNAYGRFPLSNGQDELIQIRSDLSVVSLFTADNRIGGFIAEDENLLVSINRDGTYFSMNHGREWNKTDAQTFACFAMHDGMLWACPDEYESPIWVQSESDLSRAPTPWDVGPHFSDVSAPRCAEELPECDALWPTVALEMGVDILAQFEEAESNPAQIPVEQAGCGRNAALLWMPWWVALASRRRASRIKE